jgi:hypothetical protein
MCAWHRLFFLPFFVPTVLRTLLRQEGFLVDVADRVATPSSRQIINLRDISIADAREIVKRFLGLLHWGSTWQVVVV